MQKFSIEGVLDEVKEKVSDLTQSGIAKSSQLAEMAKLQVNIATEQDNIKKIYMELGKYYYENYKDNPAPPLADACKKISLSQNIIGAHNLRIKELRNPDVILTKEGVPDDVIEAEVFSETYEADICSDTVETEANSESAQKSSEF